VWGELAAIVLGLPLSVYVWFGLDYQNPKTHATWEGLGLLFGLSFLILTVVTLVTPAESQETLITFYKRCRPPGLWGKIRGHAGPGSEPVAVGPMIINSLLGIAACLGLTIATNAIFVGQWWKVACGFGLGSVMAVWLIRRAFKTQTPEMIAHELKLDHEASSQSTDRAMLS